MFAPFFFFLYNMNSRQKANTAFAASFALFNIYAERTRKMKISELFQKKKAVYSFEIFPPKPTADYTTVQDTIRQLSELHPDYISVTCSAGGSGNSRTPEIAQLVKECGIEPLAHLTCIHADKPSVLAALESLEQAHVSNILALRGDRIEGAQESKDFAHASDLITFIRESGRDFDIAAACYPEGHPESDSLAADVRNLKKKVDAGARHLNSQLFFENEDFYRFEDMLAAADIDVPVQAGIMPLVKKSHVDRIISLSGAKIPARISRMIARFYDKPDSLMEAGIAYAIEQAIDLLSAGVRGVHMYVMNNPYVARRITESLSPILKEINGADNANR